MFDEAIDKLDELQLGLHVMKELNADNNVIEKQKDKIRQQEDELNKLIEEYLLDD